MLILFLIERIVCVVYERVFYLAMMTILFCTPYKFGPDFILGGIGIWARHMLVYSQNDNSISVIPVSLDRQTANTSLLGRAYSGIKEYSKIVKKISERISYDKPDVLHLCTSASISLVKDFIILQLARKHHVKTVVHYHFGRIPEIAKKNNWEWKLLKIVSKKADMSITMDRKSYEVLFPIYGEKITNIPNPLSSSITELIEELSPVERKKNKIVFVGHVIPSKGVYELVEACKEIGTVSLSLVGAISDNVRKEIVKIAGSGSDSWLTMNGEVGMRDVVREMLSASVFALPSYTEGFPNVILESMACGCSIVASDVGAIPEMLNAGSNEECGICVPPKNVVALKDALTLMLNHPDYANECSQRAKFRVNDFFSMPIVWEQLKSAWYKAAK